MKLLLISLIATITLCLQAPAFAYQEEGPYAEFNLGMMSGLAKSAVSGVPAGPGSSFRLTDQSKTVQTIPFSIGGGYSYNLSNSINWQVGFDYFQTTGFQAKGAAFYNSAKIWSYKYKVRSSGYWITNTFHFDVLSGNLTPIQPYVRILLGLARNNFYDYSATEISVPPGDFQSGTANNFAFGSDLGMSYQVSSNQVFNISLSYRSLGKIRSKKIEGAALEFPSNNLIQTGLQVGYLFQF